MIKEDSTVRDLFRVIRKRRGTIFTFFITTFTVVVMGTLLATPKYTATTKLLVERSDRNLLLVRNPYSRYDPNFLETQAQVINSTSVCNRVVKLLGLEEKYDFFFDADEEDEGIIAGAIKWFENLSSVLMNLAGLKLSGSSGVDEKNNAGQRTKADKIALLLTKEIEVESIKSSNIVGVSFKSKNPVMSTMIVNTIAEAYIEETLEMTTASTKRTIDLMKKKADEERVKLEESEKVLQDYRKSKNIITVENKLAIMPERLNELSVQLTRAQAKRKELETLYETVRNIALDEAETVSAISSSATLSSLRGQIIECEKHIMEISKKFGPKHPVMKKAQGEFNALKAKRTLEIKRVIKLIKNNYDLAISKEKGLKEQLEQAKSDTIGINEKLIQYGILNRAVETNRILYDTLIKRIKEEGVAKMKQMVNVWVLDKAKTPEKPSSPKKMLNIVLGLFLGLFGGIGLTFFLEYLDNTIRNPDDAEERLGAKVLGVILYLKGKKDKIEELMINKPSSSIAESYRSLRTSILLSKAGNPPKRILISSLAPKDGKTTTSINLAVAIAQSGNKVLLVDCDMRRPQIHTMFGLDNSSGLSMFLAGVSDKATVNEGPVPNLNIITSGPIPPNPSELLSSPRMADLFASASKKYNFIVVDTPPLLSISDSLIIAKITDGIILVTWSGVSTYDTARKAMQMISDTGTPLIGIVLNGVDLKKSDYYYKNYYRHYEYYSSNNVGAQFTDDKK